MAKTRIQHIFTKSISHSLRARITLLVILPTILTLSVFVLYDYAHHRLMMMKNLSIMASYNGQLIDGSLQHAMEVSDFAGMQTIIDTVGQNSKFHVVYLMDTSGKVIFAPNGVNKGAQLSIQDPGCITCHELPAQQRPSGVVITEKDGLQYFRSMQPIQNGPECTKCHDPGQAMIGELLTDIPVAPFAHTLQLDLKENILLGVGTILISAIIVNLGVSQLVIKRLKKVAQALANFGRGNRDQKLVTDSQDEIGQLEADFNQMQKQITIEEASTRQLSDELARQSAQREILLKKLITSQEDERNRVARELHDELGQALSGLALHSQVIEHLIKDDPERALKQLAVTRGVIEKTTEQMHELILTLRPSALDDLGLVAALRAHGERLFKDSLITFSMDTSGLNERLPAAIETTLYRTFQEALSNVVKHARADHVTIKLARKNGSLEGEVTDNGQGFSPQEAASGDPHIGGMGLLGMQERITQCGGSMEIVSARGEGTRISIHIPLAKVKDE